MTARVGARPIGVGRGPAGVDPVSPYATAPTLAVKAGVQYLAQTADYNETEADPIDVDVALSLAYPQGSCKHAPDLGHRLHSINPLGQPDENQKARDLVNTSNPLARRIASGDVEIVTVETSHENDQLRVRVGYRNLRRNPNSTLYASST
jgi:hypothetical protein